MYKDLLIPLSLLSIFGISESKNVLLDISKLLKEIKLRDTTENKHENAFKLDGHSSHKNKPRHHGRSPNLMNIQTMNLFLKPKENSEEYLRTESDRICEETGRCGCTGDRCGLQSNEIANQVNEIIDEANHFAKDKVYIKGDVDNDSAVIENVLRNLSNAVIIIIDAEDSSEETDFEDLTRNNPKINKNLKESIQEDSNKETIKSKVLKTLDASSPDDFLIHYEFVKSDLVKQLLNFILNNTPIPFKYLKEDQRQLLKNLKTMYKIGLLSVNELKPKIIQALYGKHSNSRVYPHLENNDNIYFPKWHYNSLLQYKKDILRNKVLPLTTQQKKRIINKITAKTIPKFSWRRNLDKNNNKYGIPFKLEAQELGQINP